MEGYILADGFNEAIIGIDMNAERVIYDKEYMVAILVRDEGMTPVEAIEYLDFNTWNAYVGPHTPIYSETMDYDDLMEHLNIQ